MYQPIHSDFLIHWTGKDIDNDLDPKWADNHASRTNEVTSKAYLKRLRDILENGLWMTKDEEDKTISVDGVTLNRPWVARTCFTELKLSEARAHAERFGRLGIGFKRFFLFERFGSPVVYYPPMRRNWFFFPHISHDDQGSIESYYACFLKYMCERVADHTLQYKTFDESEWRIIYSEEIRKIFIEKRQDQIPPLFVDPKDKLNLKQYEFYTALTGDKKPEYLIPLDAWFSMIIYPSLAIKNTAQSDKGIRELIGAIKGEPTRGCPDPECKNMPIEVDLDACRNF